jgi:hypothetical protein
MRRGVAFLALTAMLALAVILILSSCAKQENAEAPKSGADEAKPAAETTRPSAEAPAATQPASGPHAFVHLKDGSKVPGTIVASSQTDMVVAGDDGIERKIPLAQVKSVVYGDAQPEQPRRQAAAEPAPSRRPATAPAAQPPAAAPPASAPPATAPPTPAAPPPPPAPPVVTTKTYELPAGNEVSVRTNETIDSATAKEGQTFSVEITRDAKDADGYVVIPRGSSGNIVIKSASKGGKFHGASDLVLDLQSVTIDGKQYTLDTVDISQKGKSGVGANKRTAEYAGGGAALGAIIGAIAGGGKGAAIGAGAGAGAGVLTQIITQGPAIKVPVESVLTFKLDKALKVTVVQ